MAGKVPFGVAPPPEHWIEQARALSPTLTQSPVTIDKLVQAALLLDALAEEVWRLRGALIAAQRELGVPQPGYPMPVANAAEIIRAALGGYV